MAVVTKLKIRANGTMEAGQFVSDSDIVKLKVNSEAHVSDLDETADTVSFDKDGVIHANQFVEV